MIEYKVTSWLDGRFWKVPRIIRLTTTSKKYGFFGKEVTKSADFYCADSGGFSWHYTDKPGEADAVDQRELRKIWSYEAFQNEQKFREEQDKKETKAEIKFVQKGEGEAS